MLSRGPQTPPGVPLSTELGVAPDTARFHPERETIFWRGSGSEIELTDLGGLPLEEARFGSSQALQEVATEHRTGSGLSAVPVHSKGKD